MSAFRRALCRYLRRPPLEGLRVWADPEYRTAVEKLGNHMRASADFIERQAATIEYLEVELSIRPRIAVFREFIDRCGLASVDTDPKGRDTK